MGTVLKRGKLMGEVGDWKAAEDFEFEPNKTGRPSYRIGTMGAPETLN